MSESGQGWTFQCHRGLWKTDRWRQLVREWTGLDLQNYIGSRDRQIEKLLPPFPDRLVLLQWYENVYVFF